MGNPSFYAYGPEPDFDKDGMPSKDVPHNNDSANSTDEIDPATLPDELYFYSEPEEYDIPEWPFGNPDEIDHVAFIRLASAD